MSRLERLSREIRSDKSLWERMDYPNVGKVLLVEEDYYDGIVEDVAKLELTNQHLLKEQQKMISELTSIVIQYGTEVERLRKLFDRANKTLSEYQFDRHK